MSNNFARGSYDFFIPLEGFTIYKNGELKPRLF